MDFNQMQEQLLKFLDKNYVIKEGRFIRLYDDVHEWGLSITLAVSSIFSFEHEFCVMNLKFWSEQKGMSKIEWELAYETRKLKTQWSVEMARDLEMIHGITTAEEQVISILADELAREIDTNILKELKGETKTMDEFLGLVKCVGFETTSLLHNPVSFKPIRGFISMNYNDIKNARKSNNIWQNHFRPTGVDDKT